MEFDTKASCLFQDKGAAGENIGWTLNGRREKGAARKKLIGHTEIQSCKQQLKAVTVNS